MGSCNQYDNLLWLSYARGRLDSSVVREMESHVGTCDECREHLSFSRKIAAIIDVESPEPPGDWIREAAAKFEYVDFPEMPQEIVANLVFDSYLHATEAVRSRSLQSRHLTFELPGFDLDLWLESSGRQLSAMTGHLMAKAGRSAVILPEVRLELQIEDRVYSTTPNGFGEFSFSLDAQLDGEPLELRCIFKEGPCATVFIPC
jgi:hypothetical protein